ncbi:flavodoxin [Ligilactobacillus saerimneri]|uniref:Flavodoxin n=1 Tax=Ligilactobacillus saerimneri TaxID=228229 RepID=A0A7H9EIR0_9LACO|nr:flavodoxin [Ligilactobacillus saerimneri]KRL73893.1 flavodoxin [Ligilactobacillus saerimneri DSM 16049]MCZ0891031.1 flavodoxin [Ligilactobacillus saerimneri]MDY4003675.1 flavodoxin [Ligilactobacillus saerimneri]QLL77546.1 flavodoxin [Ligilactobacillus saerimneri]HJF29495.1 flavodoxin [Ligilactobacillus saerimneri]
MAQAKVLFASITGNNEDIADIVAEALENNGIATEVDDISMVEVSEILDYDICVICPYTYDEGSLPDEGLDFYEELADTDLNGLVFGVAGSGDTFYGDDYCKAVIDFDQQLAQANGTRGAAPVMINLAPDEDADIQKLDAFAAELAAKVQ